LFITAQMIFEKLYHCQVKCNPLFEPTNVNIRCFALVVKNWQEKLTIKLIWLLVKFSYRIMNTNYRFQSVVHIYQFLTTTTTSWFP